MCSSYVMVRFTLPKDTSNTPLGSYISLMKGFAIMHDAEKYTLGVEEKNANGGEADKHIHLSFMTDKDIKINSYQKDFRAKVLARFGIKLSGNKMYAMKCANDADDPDRWMRYPLKQQPKLKDYMFYKYEREEAERMRELAHDEYNRQVIKNCEALDKYLDKSSFKGKCYLALKSKNIKTKKPFFIEFVKYYLEKQKVPPFSKLNDYWIDYQLQIGVLSVEKWYTQTYEVE